MKEQLMYFCDMLCGHFDNSVQLENLKKEHAVPEGFPLAEHVNTICNGNIDHLPHDFDGIFVLEESYYHVDGRVNSMPHLFLFTMEQEDIVLDSYEIPDGYTKETFCASALGRLDYNLLSRSGKFTPVHYKKSDNDGSYTCHGKSMFSPVLCFTLTEKISPEVLSVSEIFEVNGKRTFGYDIPIEYRRI